VLNSTRDRVSSYVYISGQMTPPLLVFRTMENVTLSRCHVVTLSRSGRLAANDWPMPLALETSIESGLPHACTTTVR
jgi:hypothetical protein